MSSSTPPKAIYVLEVSDGVGIEGLGWQRIVKNQRWSPLPGLRASRGVHSGCFVSLWGWMESLKKKSPCDREGDRGMILLKRVNARP